VAYVGRRIAALASDPDRKRWTQKLFIPLAQPVATASSLPPFTVLMIQDIGLATPVLPYQAYPIEVATKPGPPGYAGHAGVS
jgi:hypothetical protein